MRRAILTILIITKDYVRIWWKDMGTCYKNNRSLYWTMNHTYFSSVDQREKFQKEFEQLVKKYDDEVQ